MMARVAVVVFFSLMGCGSSDSSDDEPTLQSWPDEWVALEAEVLALVNARRAEGADCTPDEHFPPADPLTRNDKLRRASRLHSQDMFERQFFEHVNPDGDEPWDRIVAQGYHYRAAGENIAEGQGTAEEVMDDWMHSRGHCENIMSADFSELGVGYFFSAQGEFKHYWTQDFGHPL